MCVCVHPLFQNGQFCSLQIVLERRSDCQTEHLYLVSDDMIIEKVKTKSNQRVSACKSLLVHDTAFTMSCL